MPRIFQNLARIYMQANYYYKIIIPLILLEIPFILAFDLVILICNDGKIFSFFSRLTPALLSAFTCANSIFALALHSANHPEYFINYVKRATFLEAFLMPFTVELPIMILTTSLVYVVEGPRTFPSGSAKNALMGMASAIVLGNMIVSLFLTRYLRAYISQMRLSPARSAPLTTKTNTE